ncbi:MGAT4 family, member E isoform X1 [Rattus norvegicus]|uniref:MGAT4 family, member E isoform 1 n=3 Tax=Rattus norvegicus TaxID=10116 RepID=UPI0003D09F74|eukprot:XP_006249957.1 PREDICTED: alpha-1,3-mannosyl-glycoprotein 4-beta-N-acetylglucosaminyltransferase-like protein MGAT4E isoform X1 [Rattus norvegicus]
MRCFIRHFFRVSVALMVLWFLIVLHVPEENKDVKTMVIKHGSKNSKSLNSWQSITSKYLKEIHQRRKTWLTVGITSESGHGQNGLLDTLASLYHASSTSEQRQMTVLVHLADSDPTWLKRTIFRISSLYRSQILTGQLLLIHAPPDAYPTVSNVQKEISQGQIYSKQNVDHAFLMSFATKLSPYFLLIEDDVFCAPNFVDHIRSKVIGRKPNTWVLLEFSNMGILGKLLHSKDLPLLTRFLLLFHKERPLDWLIRHFCTLLAQQSPILYRPFLFYHRLTHSTFTNNVTDQEQDLPCPDSLTGTVFTDMRFSDVHSPQAAYTLDESFFWSYNVSTGNYLILILNNPANLDRVQVRTGSIMDGKYILEKGQVELGYEPEGTPPNCTSFTLLGHLVQGQMDQIILKSAGSEVSCVKLAVNANQVGGLMVRHIYIWGENAEVRRNNQRYDKW